MVQYFVCVSLGQPQIFSVSSTTTFCVKGSDRKRLTTFSFDLFQSNVDTSIDNNQLFLRNASSIQKSSVLFWSGGFKLGVPDRSKGYFAIFLGERELLIKIFIILYFIICIWNHFLL